MTVRLEAIRMNFGQQQRRERRFEEARGYMMLDLPEIAIAELQSLPGHERQGADYHQLIGDALRQMKQYEESLSAFQEALDENPDDLLALMGSAWCYKRLDKLPDAIETMQQAYRSSPEEPIVLYNLSCYFSLAGQKTESLSWLGRALRMEPRLRQLIGDESDFDPLRNDPDFQFIVGEPSV